MGLSLIDKVQWAVAALLEAAVLILALQRKLFERQPLFTLYLSLLIVEQVVMAIVYGMFGVRSHISFYIFWALQALLVTSRGTAVYEVFQVLMAGFAGIWKLCRGVLLTLAAVLAFTAILTAGRSGPRISAIISTGDRGLELAIVSVLLFGLAFCRYYRVEVPGYLAWISLGFGFYSAVQVINNVFLREYLLFYFPVWRYVTLFSFDIATVLWGVALWKPLPALRLAPATLSPGAYEDFAPQMTTRLRELNSRLLEMWK